MADSAAPAPRPRPRPRPKPVAKNPNTNPGPSSSSLTSASSSESVTRRASEIEEEDAYFMKNRNRSSKTWQKLEQMSKEATKPKPLVKCDESSDSEGNSSPRRSKRTKREKGTSVPLWQKRRDLLSQALSSSSDSEVELTSKGESTPKGKRKRRDRSRSRSITPPPALPQAQIQNAKNVVRQTLQATVRPPSPSIFIDPDESTDTIVFDQELNALAKEIVAGRGSSVAPEQEAPTTTTGGDNIVFAVKWQPHPEDPQAQHGVGWQYRIERTDNFRELFEATAEDAKVVVPNLIMTYQGKRFFPSVTPQTLKIWTDKAEIVAYEKRAYEYIQKNPHSVVRPIATNSSTPTTSTNNPLHNDPASSFEPSHLLSTIQESDTESQAGAESDAGNDEEDDKFKLILRSALTGDITLTVRPTTKCGAILRAFLKKAKLADRPDYKEVFAAAAGGGNGTGRSKGKPGAKGKDPRLCIDGDRMENQTEIGADLEDGDMVEVVGL